MKPLYVKIRETIKPAKFKMQFLNLLQEYSRDLLDESNTAVEKGVAEFVRRSRRRITSKLVPIIYDGLSGKLLFLPPKEKDPGDRDKRLEE